MNLVHRTLVVAAITVTAFAANLKADETYSDRFVWIFGWGLRQDQEVEEIVQVLDTAAQHGINGAVMSLGLDTLCKKSPEYFRRLEQVQEAYLVDGDFTGSWKHVPKDLTIAVWGGAPRDKSLQFFADEGFRTLVACYYDADDLKDVSDWLRLARQTPNVGGFMYTPWQKKYQLLPDFGDMIRQ